MRITRKVIFAGLAAICLVLIGVQALRWAEAYYLRRAQDSGQSTLHLVAEAMDQAVGRYGPVPGLVAGEPVLRDLLLLEDTRGLAPFVNEKLRQVAISVGASEVYVMDRSGLTVAASNYRDTDSFVGQNFAYRPYFARALAGEAARFHALGTTSGERGFFFSAPILDGIDVIGVLALKITVGALESGWSGTGREILIADDNGVVFLASRAAYRLRALAPLSGSVRARISQTRQFPLDRLDPMPLSARVIGRGAVTVSMDDSGADADFLAQSLPLDLAGWHAIALTPLYPVRAQALSRVGFWGLALLACGLVGVVVAQRRISLLHRMQFERDQRDLLEGQVRARTADLDAANQSLRDEVVERRFAEDRLRKSQKDLIQAGKLAALGQMSAAISHEINQPLAAIKTYADNAGEFLVRNRTADAGVNIRSISEMADRMAEISRHLRNFARQPSDTLKPVHVQEAITAALALVGPQVRTRQADIRWTPQTEPIWIRGGPLRLQQVLVNIIKNALEAVTAQETPLIEIDVEADDSRAAIRIRDHGPGVPPETLDQVFDAFYTTKDAGKDTGAGMGLGMSISHNIVSDFGGTLTVANHPQGGAVFTVALQRCPPHAEGGP